MVYAPSRWGKEQAHFQSRTAEDRTDIEWRDANRAAPTRRDATCQTRVHGCLCCLWGIVIVGRRYQESALPISVTSRDPVAVVGFLEVAVEGVPAPILRLIEPHFLVSPLVPRNDPISGSVRSDAFRFAVDRFTRYYEQIAPLSRDHRLLDTDTNLFSDPDSNAQPPAMTKYGCCTQ